MSASRRARFSFRLSARSCCRRGEPVRNSITVRTRPVARRTKTNTAIAKNIDSLIAFLPGRQAGELEVDSEGQDRRHPDRGKQGVLIEAVEPEKTGHGE